MLKESIIAFLCSFCQRHPNSFLISFLLAGLFLLSSLLLVSVESVQFEGREILTFQICHAAHQLCAHSRVWSQVQTQLVEGLQGTTMRAPGGGSGNWSVCAPSDGVADHCLVWSPVSANF